MTSTTANPLPQAVPPIYNLPVELLESIFAQLEYPNLARVRNTSRVFRAHCDSAAISTETKLLITLRETARSDPSTSLIRRSLASFVVDFDRKEYLRQIGEDFVPAFTQWILETPKEDILGWHWPGFRGEHSRDRHDELGLNFSNAMMFSRHMKPGYTLLPSANVMEVEDPDYSEHNETDHHFYPGSWQCQRPMRDHKVRALQIWADMSGFSPKITLLILSGSERWDGHVWQTETRSPFRHSPETIRADQGVQLIWQKPLGTWLYYLRDECKMLQERFHTSANVHAYRRGYSGAAYLMSP